MVVVVGAGPAGLATAYYLKQYKIPYTVLERHRVGHAWQNHYDSLRLHTLKGVSALPGLPMPRHYPPFPSAGQVHAYLRHYVAQFDLIVRERVTVQRATYGVWQGTGGSWHITTDKEEGMADQLVAATGIWSTPYQPDFAKLADFGGLVIHSRDYKNPDLFLGKRVLVVGEGNSGTEMAVELGEAGIETGLVVHQGVSFVRYPSSAWAMRLADVFLRVAPRPVGHTLLKLSRPDYSHIGLPPPSDLVSAYPVVGFELPEAVQAGRVTVYPDIKTFMSGRVQFVDGQTKPFEAVIMATGYRPTLSFVEDALELTADGWPILQKGRSTRNHDLFCVGYHYPTTSGWFQAIGRQAHQVVKQIRKRRR